MSDWVEIRTVGDPDLRAQLEERVRLSVERDRGGPVPVPQAGRLLCGCVDPAPGTPESIVRKDGSCRACSP